jgi:hypothetical protein
MGIPEGIGNVLKLVKAVADPQERAGLAQAWDSMSPQDKQKVSDAIGEALGSGIGGFLGGASGAAGGSLAFGLGAAPGAVAGAAAGAGLGGAAGHFVSRLVGHFANPHGSDGYTAAQNARDVGNAVTGNAAIEGLLRAPAMLKGAAKSVVAPTPEAAQTARIAQSEGIPQTLGTATGNKMIQKVEAGLALHPFSAETMLAAKQRAQAAFEASLNRFMGAQHATPVGDEGFRDAVTAAAQEARGEFQRSLNESTAATAKKFGPMRTATQAGQDLQTGLADNQAMLKKWADTQYPTLYDDANKANVSINPQQMADAAGETLDRIAPETRWAFPRKGMNALQNASEMREPLNIDTSNGVVTGRGEAQPLTLEEAVKLRSQLLDAQRRLPHTASSMDRQALSVLTDNLNSSIEKSMQNSGDIDLLDRWKLMNNQFRQGAEATRPPASAGKPGNPMARVIRNSAEPERLVKEATDNPSSIAQADLATNPNTITRATGQPTRVAPAPMDSVRRNVFDTIVDKNRAKNPPVPGGAQTAGSGDLSPTDFVATMTNPKDAERYSTLFGNKTDDILTSMRDAMPREGELYDSKLGRAVDSVNSGSSASLRNAAFPPHNAPAAQSTIDLFKIGPSQPGDIFGRGAARRAFVENLVDQSTKPGGRLINRATGNAEGVIDPFALTNRLHDAGETAGTVLGDEQTGSLNNILKVGRSNFSPEALFGNPSGTAHTRELFSIGKRLAGAGTIGFVLNPTAAAKTLGLMGAEYLGTKGAAKWVTSPRVVNWALDQAPLNLAASKAATGAQLVKGAPSIERKEGAGDGGFIPDDGGFIQDAPEDDGAFIPDPPAAGNPMARPLDDGRFIPDPVVPMARPRAGSR